MKIAITLALAATASLALASQASAQTAAQPAPLGGAVIPGVCIYSNERAIATSTVGLAVLDRLKQIAGQAQAEVQQVGQQLQSEQTALQASSSTLPKDQLDQRAGMLQAHYEQFQRLRQLREAEIEATRNKEFDVIGQQIDPLLRQIYTERNCGVVVAANSTYGFYNQQMDVTRLVIDRLNTKMQSLSFDRVHLDQGQGQGAAGAPQQPTSVAPAPAPRKRK
jgi:outer membrane protein